MSAWVVRRSVGREVLRVTWGLLRGSGRVRGARLVAVVEVRLRTLGFVTEQPHALLGMECAWRVHGVCMACVSHGHGMCMACAVPWTHHGVHVVCMHMHIRVSCTHAYHAPSAPLVSLVP